MMVVTLEDHDGTVFHRWDIAEGERVTLVGDLVVLPDGDTPIQHDKATNQWQVVGVEYRPQPVLAITNTPDEHRASEMDEGSMR